MKKLLNLLFIVLISVVVNAQNGVVPGHLLVQFKTSTSQDEFIRDFQLKHDYIVSEFNLLSKTANIYQIVFEDASINLEKAKADLYTYDAVNLVQFNHYVTQRETVPTDTLFSNQWFHKNTGQTGGTLDADIDTPDAWDITTGGVTTHGDTIVVCIIEGSGVDISHVDLVDNIWHNYGEIPNNGIDDDNNGYIDDFNGWNVQTLDDGVGSGSHGTRVAGMVGAKGNNIAGVSGVNWDVKMMIVKGQQASNEASVIAAYDYPLTMRKMYNDSYGQEGAFVVVTNASWGIDNGDPADAPLWCAMYDTLGTYGILNVAATTNNNSNVDQVGDLPTACPSQYLIGVTMTDDTDTRANSGYGPTHVDLAAPGSGVYLPIPGNFYSTTNGTSFASPCVAGSIALLYSAPCADFIHQVKIDPASTTLDMKNWILNSVDVIPALTGEVGTNGRLNVKNALDDLLSDCNSSVCTQPYYVHSNDITDTSATFIWQGFSTDYLFYITEGSGPEVEIALSNQDSIYFDTLIPCTQYSIRVKGICGTDTSDFSSPFSFTTDGCCNNPELYMLEDTVTQLTIGWDPILYATEYDLRYRKLGEMSWIATLLDTVSPVQINGLDTCTTYEFQIKTICTDSTHGFSPSYEFTTTGCGACYEANYCEVIGANDNFEWIESVEIYGWISNTGANNGYYSSSDILVSMAPGQTYPLVLTPGYSSTIFTERFSIWVDLDHDGVFQPAEELLDNVSTTTQVIDDITIPLGTPSGITKMRIGMNGTTSPVACPSSSFFGEYEDYCVYIGEDAGTEEKILDLSIYPNPATNLLYITSSQLIQEIFIYSLEGKLVFQCTTASSAIDITSLKKGMYIIQVHTDQGIAIQKFVKQ